MNKNSFVWRTAAVALIVLAIIAVLNIADQNQDASQRSAEEEVAVEELAQSSEQQDEMALPFEQGKFAQWLEQEAAPVFIGPGPGCEPAADVPDVKIPQAQQQLAAQQLKLEPPQRYENWQSLLDSGISSISYGSFDQALYQLSQAHAMIFALADEDPKNVKWGMALAKNKESCALVLEKQNKTPAAKAMFQQASRLRQDIIKSGNASAEIYHELASGNSNFAEMEGEANEFTQLEGDANANSNVLALRAEAMIEFTRAAFMDTDNQQYQHDKTLALQNFYEAMQQQTLPVQQQTLEKMLQQVGSFERQIPQVASAIYIHLAATYLEILNDEQHAYSISSKAIALTDDPDSDAICSHAEATLAAARKAAESIANSQRCVEHAILRQQKVVGLALEYGARLLAGQKQQLNKNGKALQDALMALGDHSLHWTFAGSRSALAKRKLPQAIQVAKLFAALEIEDETMRAKTTYKVLREIRRGER